MKHLVAVVLSALAAPVSMAQDAEPALKGVALIQDQAQNLRPLVESEPGHKFLDATGALPAIEPRTIHLNREQRRWLTAAQFNALPETDRAGFEARPIDEDRYYQTKYGSPLVYIRAIDILANAGALPTGFRGVRIADYGYGTVGHLRLMASLGADVTGIDVDPFLTAVYSESSDTGSVNPAGAGPAGRITLVDGLWPAAVSAQVGQGYDIFLSKNTLKNGYIHPSQPVDKRLLVDLSVPEEEYVKAVRNALKPGGWFLIYNLSPAPSKEGEPFKHWSDGSCPFPRAMLEAAGFDVVVLDANDDAKARAVFETLGYPTKAADGTDDLFTHYTLARRSH